MRLDKFLALSRLIKRRTLAQQACAAGKVLLNGRPAKPGHTVEKGDVIEIRLGSKELRVRVVQVPEGNVAKDAAKALYSLLSS